MEWERGDVHAEEAEVHRRGQTQPVAQLQSTGDNETRNLPSIRDHLLMRIWRNLQLSCSYRRRENR